ncbi:MAG: hypothetical protein ACRYG7_44900 [Janthinobacterium lividum]
MRLIFVFFAAQALLNIQQNLVPVNGQLVSQLSKKALHGASVLLIFK